MERTGAEIIAGTLKSLGVKRVFMYPGVTVAPLLNALISEGIEYICTRTEQGAGYGAIGAAKRTNETQVVIVTSGPGATNILTPVADAYYDSVPLLVFTGQVGTNAINYEKNIRQTGFQETDTVSRFKPVTKRSVLLDTNEEIDAKIRDAYDLTKKGRFGPVVVDLPMDIQRSPAPEGDSPETSAATDQEPGLQNKIRTIVQTISEARKPLILAGNGVHLSDATEELRSLAEKNSIPVVASLPGLGAIPSDHPLFKGFIGHVGEYYANLALHGCDVLIVLGARLDLRQTGSEIEGFNKNKKIIRIDIDKNELDHARIKADISINTDLKTALGKLLEIQSPNPAEKHSAWISQIDSWKNEYSSSQFYEKEDLSAYAIIKAVDEATRSHEVIVTSGVGAHQAMAARYFTFDHPNRIWMTSSGHGTMGFDIPTAIGAVISSPDKATAIVFVGDGSFQMNIQELATIKEHDLPVKIFVLDDCCLNLVSQFQRLTWGSDPSTGNKQNPPFADIAKAYGIEGYVIEKESDIPPVLKKALKDDKPAVVW